MPSKSFLAVAALLLAGLATMSPAQAYWPSFHRSSAPACNETCNQACPPNSSVSGCVRNTYQEIEAGRQVNAMWPYPHVCADRTRTMAPFDTMVNNGWRRQNLLGNHHFDPETTKLTKAGQLKVGWILTQAPPQHRQIYVERSFTPGVTEQRIAAAQAFGNTATFDGSEAIVRDTHLMSEGRPAGLVDHVQNSFRESMPAVVLPAASSTSSSSN